MGWHYGTAKHDTTAVLSTPHTAPAQHLTPTPEQPWVTLDATQSGEPHLTKQSQRIKRTTSPTLEQLDSYYKHSNTKRN